MRRRDVCLDDEFITGDSPLMVACVTMGILKATPAHINANIFSCKATIIIFRCSLKFEYAGRFEQNSPHIKFNENPLCYYRVVTCKTDIHGVAFVISFQACLEVGTLSIADYLRKKYMKIHNSWVMQIKQNSYVIASIKTKLSHKEIYKFG